MHCDVHSIVWGGSHNSLEELQLVFVEGAVVHFSFVFLVCYDLYQSTHHQSSFKTHRTWRTPIFVTAPSFLRAEANGSVPRPALVRLALMDGCGLPQAPPAGAGHAGSFPLSRAETKVLRTF